MHTVWRFTTGRDCFLTWVAIWNTYRFRMRPTRLVTLPPLLVAVLVAGIPKNPNPLRNWGGEEERLNPPVILAFADKNPNFHFNPVSVTGGDKLGKDLRKSREIDRVLTMVCAAEVPKYRQTIGLYCSDVTLAFIHSALLHWEPHQ